MFRRDVLATLLSMLSVSSLGALFEEIAAVTDGLHTDGGDAPGAGGNESGTDQSGTAQNGTTQTTDDDALADGTADDPDTRTAVVDRIENEIAVVIFDDGGTESVPAAVLPEAAREEGKVLDVPEGTSLALATVDHAATAKRKQEAQEQFDELATDAPDSNDSGNATTVP